MNRFCWQHQLNGKVLFSNAFLLFRRSPLRAFYHMFTIAECTKEEANLRKPIRSVQLPQMLRYPLLGGEAREQHHRLLEFPGQDT